MGSFDDLRGDEQAAPAPCYDTIDRPLCNPSPPRERRIRLVYDRDVYAKSHAVIFNGSAMTSQVIYDGRVSADISAYPPGVDDQDATSDIALARNVAQRLYTPGKATKAAASMGIKPRTFQRFLSGQNLKAAEWTRLVNYPEFAQEFAKEKGARAPQLDRATQEGMGRLARALGPELLKAAVYEIENLVSITGPAKTVSALVRLKETAAEVAESVAEFAERQKSS